MHPPLSSLLFLSICITSAFADLLGPSYTAPVDLSSNQSLVAAGWKNFTSTIKTYLDDDSQSLTSEATSEIKNITFSVGMFSLNDPAASELQFHYTSPEVVNAPNGTHEVDGDSIYRIASLTKVFTVLAGLLELKSADWDRPILDIFPGLANSPPTNLPAGGDVYTTQWDKVTAKALAAQIAGIARDILPAAPGDIMLPILSAIQQGKTPLDPTKLGLPPVNQSDPLELPPCIFTDSEYCPEIPYIESAGNRPPAFLPWTTPGYSDNGFVLLGLIISNITGKSMDQLFLEGIFKPLDMTSSNSSTPPESEWYRSVIPVEPAGNFAFDAGIFVSTGALSSTTRDLAKFGIGILNSTLLPSDQTRKWLKPVSHTARFQYSLGSPWEIMRYVLPSGRITDIYTKSGDSGVYSSWLVLLPDYDAGFTILSSGSTPSRTQLAAVLADLVTNSVLPALEAQGAAEAECNFIGTYNSTTEGLNSSLTLVRSQNETSPPGLVVLSWISNGTDVLTALSETFGQAPWRLIPSISDAETGTAAFRLVAANDAPSPQVPGQLFSGPGYLHADWILLDAATYGGLGLGLFVFDVGSDGKALAVRPAAFRTTLKKTA